MRPPFIDWQRRPVLFATGLAALSVLGLVVMLADEGPWKVAGFACALLPGLLAGTCYLARRPRS